LRQGEHRHIDILRKALLARSFVQEASGDASRTDLQTHLGIFKNDVVRLGS
jgi:hypothetical protein